MNFSLGDRTIVRKRESNLGNLICDAMIESWSDNEVNNVLGDIHLGKNQKLYIVAFIYTNDNIFTILKSF